METLEKFERGGMPTMMSRFEGSLGRVGVEESLTNLWVGTATRGVSTD